MKNDQGTLFFDDGRCGMQHIVTTVKREPHLTARHVLQHQAYYATRPMMDSTCIVKSEGGLDVGIDILLHRQRNWPTHLRGAAAMACHTGVHKYVQFIRTRNDGIPTDGTIDDLPVWQFKGRFTTYTPHGTVITEFMGVAEGCPNWDDLCAELTRRLAMIFREQAASPGHETIQFWNRMADNYPIGLIFRTNQPHQRWGEGEGAFTEGPSNAGVAVWFTQKPSGSSFERKRQVDRQTWYAKDTPPSLDM